MEEAVLKVSAREKAIICFQMCISRKDKIGDYYEQTIMENVMSFSANQWTFEVINQQLSHYFKAEHLLSLQHSEIVEDEIL